MAEITRQRTGELLQTLFAILAKEPEGLQASEALSRLAHSVPLTDYEAGEYPGGGRRFDKIVRFATIDCVKAGWLLKHKGVWRLTDLGATALQKYKDPVVFYKEAVRLYRQWKLSQGKPDAGLAADSTEIASDAVEKTSVTFEEADEQAWQEIRTYLGAMNPFEFQELVADLLRGMGYHVPWVAPQGKDGGVDILAFTDALGAQGPRIKVQVKRWTNKVAADGIKAFIANLGGGDVGIYVALGGFTKDAEDVVRNQETKRITLIDGPRLLELWIEHYGRLDDQARQRLPLTPIYFLTPAA